MPGGRHSPALFELIRDKTGSAPAKPAPQPAQPAPAAAPQPIPAAKPAPAPRPVVHIEPQPLENSPADPGRPATRTITLTTSLISMTVFAALVIGIGIWAVAYRSGFSRGESNALRDLNLPSNGGLKDPLKSPAIPVNPDLLATTGSTGATTPRGQSATPPAPPRPAAATGDTRVVGLNYLVLALKMDKESAERAAAFFAENGVQTIMIPVANSGRTANNPGSYALYAATGITPEEYKSRAPVMTELKEKVTRLGKTWQRQHRGSTDFSDTYWERKKP